MKLVTVIESESNNLHFEDIKTNQFVTMKHLAEAQINEESSDTK
jgi:hypothetical protein